MTAGIDVRAQVLAVAGLVGLLVAVPPAGVVAGVLVGAWAFRRHARGLLAAVAVALVAFAGWLLAALPT